jgi:aminodeoxyfutalosine deaminase
MAFKKFKATQLFDGYTLYDNNNILITDEKGKIESIVSTTEAGDDVQSFDGILTPGLINCHCHLELSHLKDVIPPHTGLIEFLCSVVTKRDFAAEIIQEAIQKAEKEMYDNGIVAVGDIGNTADTATVKSNSNIRWQNFVEVISFTDERASENMQQYQLVLNAMQKAAGGSSNIRSSLVPHAPYSISPKTFQLINAATKNEIISIHNQEHPAEDELYKTGGGDFLKLFSIFGIHQSPFPVTSKSSLQSYLPYFNNGQTIFLIHNTYMPEEDIRFAKAYAANNNLNLVYCLCVNANLYIENKTPPIDQFITNSCQLVLGTDSYSSNWQLSIAKEIQSIVKSFPHLPLKDVLQMATLNGAKALQWEDQLGSFEKGKKPGVVLLENDLSRSGRVI